MFADALQKLQRGEQAIVYPKGQSMRPRIKSGQRVLLAPIEDHSQLNKEQVVLVRVKGRWYLHRITARDGQRIQIGNMRGGINGWVKENAAVGLVVEVG